MTYLNILRAVQRQSVDVLKQCKQVRFNINSPLVRCNVRLCNFGIHFLDVHNAQVRRA